MFPDATPEAIGEAANRSAQAFQQYRLTSLQQRAALLRDIANQLSLNEKQLLATAAEETHLTTERLASELKRTGFQLATYADACEGGHWLDVRIDTADAARQPPKPDLRKTMIPLGPVVVFGASNFPFAYSTAGGDTACALAAGCTVVVKAHPAHPQTSEVVAAIIKKAVQNCGLAEDIFMHVHGASFESGKALVLHPLVKAVGFTGSLQGGRALFDLAASRPEPIPVFAEMGSTNPVFLLPQKLAQDAEAIAAMYTASITQSVGQFCTNPGIIVGIGDSSFGYFIKSLGKKIRTTAPQKMLHSGIAQSFKQRRGMMLETSGVEVAATNDAAAPDESIPTLAQTTGEVFLKNGLLHEEVFGPYALVVCCTDAAEMLHVANALPGQLTTTLMATEEEAEQHETLIATLQQRCGRLIFNGVPTGVDVALSMHHGGPYPATTDSRFTAVGADGIRRFARPVCYQSWPDGLLPDALKNSNPLGLWRTVNNELTKDPL